MACQYTFPPQSVFAGAIGTAMAGLQYNCLTCEVKSTTATSLKLHVEGKAHKKKVGSVGLAEDPSIEGKCDKYISLEAPHIDANKANKKNKFSELLVKKKEEKDSMTKEEWKELTAERKRKAIEDGTASNKKKKKKGDGYTCTVCDVTLNSDEQMKLHTESKKHIAKMNAGPQAGQQSMPNLPGVPPQMMKQLMAMLGGGGGDWGAPSWGSGGGGGDPAAGCQACGVPGPLNPNHFDSKAHKRNAGGGAAPTPTGSVAAAPGSGKKKKAKGAPAEGGGGTLVDGCAACGITGPLNPNHFEGKKHKIAMGEA